MRQIFCCALFFFSIVHAHAGIVSGVVSNEKGQPLSFASIIVKGSSKGNVANSFGKYSIELSPGKYTIICQHIGYKSQEKELTVTAENVVVHFQLVIQELNMQEVVIKVGEDPALQMIRETIKRRDFYNKQVDSFSVDVYIKGLMRSRAMPDKIFGQKIDKDDMQNGGVDSAGKGILFLSESQTKVSFQQPNKIKYDVISSRESGGGYGLSFPFFINFYTNNVSVFDNRLNPRGFVSPIADGALHFYKYKFEGNFFEGDKMINRIRVTPRRKFEPLFNGYIQIVDGEWRIHSLELTTTKDYQLELIDTIKITQLHAAITANVWRTQNQVLYVAANFFGFDITGNFLNVYTNYNLNPGFGKKTFTRTFMTYDTAFNKRDSSYWNGMRPVALEPDEKKDFIVKDSMSKAFRDSMYSRSNIDSLRRKQKPIELKQFFVGGVRRSFYSAKAFSNYQLKPLLPRLEYNTVEGLAINVNQELNVRPRKGALNYFLEWQSRYGISNKHFNSHLSLTLRSKRDSYRNRFLQIAGGKRVSQFNRENPIHPMVNTFYTLLERRNYIKLYENIFGSVTYNNRFENGLQWNISATYENRIPLNNTTDFAFFKKGKTLLPNHPYELAAVAFEKHKAFVAGLTLSYQPGQRYIQFPHTKMAVGSDAPTFQLNYTKGLRSVFGSVADFDKWRLSMFDEMNFKIAGAFHYRISVGGFLHSTRVDIPDFQHFNGNQTLFSSQYLNSFQLAPYYRYSNIENLYAVLHAEHHFNGLLTNKIPLFNRLKWHLVGGTNTFYVNRNNYYVEVFAGIENILKIFRVDFVTAYQSQPGNVFGVRIGMGGIIGGALQASIGQ